MSLVLCTCTCRHIVCLSISLMKTETVHKGGKSLAWRAKKYNLCRFLNYQLYFSETRNTSEEKHQKVKCAQQKGIRRFLIQCTLQTMACNRLSLNSIGNRHKPAYNEIVEMCLCPPMWLQHTCNNYKTTKLSQLNEYSYKHFIYSMKHAQIWVTLVVFNLWVHLQYHVLRIRIQFHFLISIAVFMSIWSGISHAVMIECMWTKCCHVTSY